MAYINLLETKQGKHIIENFIKGQALVQPVFERVSASPAHFKCQQKEGCVPLPGTPDTRRTCRADAFTSFERLISHLIHDHWCTVLCDSTWFCAKCEIVFTDRKQRAWHARASCDGFKHKCELCPIGFLTARGLAIHLKRTHNVKCEKPKTHFTCHICLLNFAYKVTYILVVMSYRWSPHVHNGFFSTFRAH